MRQLCRSLVHRIDRFQDLHRKHKKIYTQARIARIAVHSKCILSMACPKMLVIAQLIFLATKMDIHTHAFLCGSDRLGPNPEL